MKTTLLICLSLSLIVAFQRDFPELEGPYLGQNPPGMKAQIFASGIISTIEMPEMCAAFTPDGKQFFFNALYEGQWSIFMTKETNGMWTTPKPMPFTAGYTDRDFTLSPDGRMIYFGSNRPRERKAKPLKALDIYMTERLDGEHWSEPKNIGIVVNSERGENYPSVARNGNLYFFSSRDDSLGGCDIYVARLIDGQFRPPENLGSAVNSVQNDWDGYIAPDESYFIFSSQNRDDTLGGQDLYICFRKQDGRWTKARNMGARVNSASGEICPSVTLDGKYLFFTSRRRGKADIFWVDAKIIHRLRPDGLSLAPRNFF
jgi:Tol biopolymer transport system component